MEHLSITFPVDLRKEVDRCAKLEHTKRSTLIQKAVKVYLGLKYRAQLEQDLKAGYLEMAGESQNLMDEFKNIDAESWKYAG